MRQGDPDSTLVRAAKLGGTLLIAGACATTGASAGTPAPVSAALPMAVASAHRAWQPSSCDGRLLDKLYYVVCHAAPWRIPRWVAYHLDSTDLPGTVLMAVSG